MDAEKLRSLLAYNPATGEFRWKVKRNKINPGDLAGCINPKGYRVISLDGRLYRANRLAWLYVNGTWPAEYVDHINGDRLDNRIDNLRDVPRFVNAQNRHHAARTSTSRLLGVSWNSQNRKWRAQIQVNRQLHYLGEHPSEEAAHAAYVAARSRLIPA